jgi:DNA-directed RNA polymerase subunit RPC12/RpoP
MRTLETIELRRTAARHGPQQQHARYCVRGCRRTTLLWLMRPGTSRRPSRLLQQRNSLLWLRLCLLAQVAGFLAFLLPLTACHKDVAYDAINSDANGYVCLKCGAKLYTDRSVFIGPKCPKCNEDTLIEVVGYYCEKDKHLTIRARRGDPQGSVCEQCQAPLVNAMRSPREKELKAWGATKASS